MKKFVFSFALLCTLLIEPANAMGLFYTDATYPMTATGVMTNQPVSCLKHGASSALNVLWLVETGDCGLDAASKNGDIKQVYYVDVHEKSVFIFYKKTTTTVYGE